MKDFLLDRIKAPQVPFVESFYAPIDDSLIRKFRELSEDLWEINQFNSPQFSEAEVIPLVASAAEIDDEGRFKAATTQAVTSDFEKLLGDIEFTMSLSTNNSSLLRAVMVRLKPKCKIYPFIDSTFSGIPHSLYRCQLSGESKITLYDEDLVKVKSFSSKVKRFYYMYENCITSEENEGLNDSIFLLCYMQPRIVDEKAKKLVLNNQIKFEKENHKKSFRSGL